MYKTILVPLDGSPRAEAIIPHVESLATCYQARVLFLLVVDPVFTLVSPYDIIPDFNAEEARRRVNEARAYLSGWQGTCREKGIDADVVVEYGPVIVGTILDVAQRENADLIAMASHGRSGLARVFYGSVAAGMLSQADRPLLLIRAPDEG